MHYELGIFNNAISSIAKMLSKWEKDLNEFQVLIDEKKGAGEPVGGMEINLRKGCQRYNEFVSFAEIAIGCIRAMELNIKENEDRKAQAELKSLQKRIRDIERRTGIPMHEW